MPMRVLPLAAMSFVLLLVAGCGSSSGLSEDQSIDEIKSLYLDKTKVTGAGLAHLKGMTQLSELRLDDTGVDDKGLDQVKALPKLKRVTVRDAKVTDEGAESFRKALPNVDLMYP